MATHPAKFFALLVLILSVETSGMAVQTRSGDDQFGPVVRAYLGYLKNEQEVVDDRVSRREISASYYRRNSNRIRALRQMAIKLARDSGNDYLPELEAVTGEEFGLLFERPPQPATLKVGEVVRNTFRYLGSARSGEVFYIFARLDPYEQADLKAKNPETKQNAGPTPPPVTTPASGGPKSMSRARKVGQ